MSGKDPLQPSSFLMIQFEEPMCTSDNFYANLEVSAMLPIFVFASIWVFCLFREAIHRQTRGQLHRR